MSTRLWQFRGDRLISNLLLNPTWVDRRGATRSKRKPPSVLLTTVTASEHAIAVLLVPDDVAGQITRNGTVVTAGLHPLRHADRFDRIPGDHDCPSAHRRDGAKRHPHAACRGSERGLGREQANAESPARHAHRTSVERASSTAPVREDRAQVRRHLRKKANGHTHSMPLAACHS